MQRISNQYAAMPSLHVAWATWGTLVLSQLVRRRVARGLAVAYPGATVFAIVVTANHYWIDAVGGLLTLLIGYGLASLLSRWHVARPLGRARDGSGPALMSPSPPDVPIRS